MIETTLFPTNSLKMRKVLFACNVHGSFTENFSKITRPLIDYSRMEKELDWSDPATEALHAWNTLKSRLEEPPVLDLLQPHRP